MRINAIILLATTAMLVTGCQEEAARVQNAKNKTLKITAHLAFRPTQNAKFAQRKLTVNVPVLNGPVPEIAQAFPAKEEKFQDMKVVVRYFTNSFMMTVFDTTNDKILFRNLYQFGPDLRNQFHGGHGFTGLSYIDHPTSRTHLQFWCTVEKGK